MNNKTTLFIGAFVLVLVSFFVGRNFFQNENPTLPQNGEQNMMQTDKGMNVDSLLSKSNGYDVNERRTLTPIENGNEASILLAHVYEASNLVDQSNGLSYRVYRVGQGDVPPTYSAGRIFLQVTDLRLPGNPIAVYDTEIDGVEPLGNLSIEGNALNIACADVNACEYSLTYTRNAGELSVARSR